MRICKWVALPLALITSSVVEAREALIANFDQVDRASPGDHVERSLRTHWQSLDVSRLHEPVAPNDRLAVTAEDSSQSGCFRSAYTRTWWLPRDVELRRAAQFDAMAMIACEFRIPALLLDAVVAQESGYKPWAVSRAGAMGLMQIMPGTAIKLGLRHPWDAYSNLRAGARYLRQQLDRFDRVDLALAAYNAGPERQSLAFGRVPAIPETMNYVRTITTNWVRLTQLGNTSPEALVRATAASQAVRAAGYREVSLTTYDGTNAANPI